MPKGFNNKGNGNRQSYNPHRGQRPAHPTQFSSAPMQAARHTDYKPTPPPFIPAQAGPVVYMLNAYMAVHATAQAQPLAALPAVQAPTFS